VSNQIHQLDKNQVIARIRSMDEVVALSLAPRRAPMWLMGVLVRSHCFSLQLEFTAVLSYYVLQRRQEIGLRMALGAQRANVLQLILGHAAKLIATGVVIGLAAAFAAFPRAHEHAIRSDANRYSNFPGGVCTVGSTRAARMCCPGIPGNTRGPARGAEE